MYGYSAEEITGKSIDLLSSPGQAGEMHTILARIRAGQHVKHLETTRVRKDGSAITVSLTPRSSPATPTPAPPSTTTAPEASSTDTASTSK